MFFDRTTVGGSEIRRENQLRLVVYLPLFTTGFIHVRWFSRRISSINSSPAPSRPSGGLTCNSEEGDWDPKQEVLWAMVKGEYHNITNVMTIHCTIIFI